MRTKTASIMLASLAYAAAMGCGSSGGSTTPLGEVRAALHRAKSCPDLLSDLKSDAIYKLDKQINLQIRQIQACRSKYSDDRCANGGYYALSGRGDASFNGGAPEAAMDNAAAAPTASGGEKSSASSYSETNVQVKGVDEADIVKNDGTNLYILHGRAFKVINAWPADQLKEVGTLDIEGTPTEMFVADGKVVVYSQVNGAAIFAAANVSPKTQYNGYAYSGASDVAIAPGEPNGKGTPTGPYSPLTKISVLQLDGTTPKLTREVYFEGSYLDARRVGTHVRTVLQSYAYGPQLKSGIYELYQRPDGQYDQSKVPQTGTATIQALEQLRAANRAVINASQLGDWLPYTFLKNGAEVKASTVKCEDFYVPTVGSTESGLTEVAAIDLANPAGDPQETAIVGRADTVYGNADSLYLAAHAWVEPPFVWYDDGGAVASDTVAASPPSSGAVPTPAPDTKSIKPSTLRPQAQPAQVITYSTSRTHLHKFEFATQPAFPNYVASGTVAGYVKDQFSLDEKDGNIRLATTENLQYFTTDNKYVSDGVARPNTVNHLFVLGQDGPWLAERGSLADLAPNEQIKSVRFIENRGYVVTFRQVDPLFVIDLANPATPTLLAALKIPGFSEYMHPLGNNHLLTIGRDATAEGRRLGLTLQIFDVTDGRNPIAKHKVVYNGDAYGSSEAEYDQKAFTYFADKQLLAFPYYSQATNTGMRSSLEVFKVDVTSGFNQVGSIDHSELVKPYANDTCGNYYGPSVRRGVFLENFVYSISYGGIVVRDAANIDAGGPSLALPAPANNDGYGVVCKY